jgi:small subunit ribosomal protein S7
MRKKKAKKRYVVPDPVYGKDIVTKFVNCMMYDGKKSLAYKIFYEAIDDITKITEQDGIEVWTKALDNVMPSVEVKSRRVGGATYQIPVEVRPDRRVYLGMKWLINYSRSRAEKTMKDKLVNEIIAASKEEGNAVKKKNDIHKMASSNRAFSHFKL